MIEQLKWKEWIRRGEVELSRRVIERGGVMDTEQAESLRLALENEKGEDEDEDRDYRWATFTRAQTK